MSLPTPIALPRHWPRAALTALVLTCAACGEAPAPPPAKNAEVVTNGSADSVVAAASDGVQVDARYPAMRSELAPLEAAMHAYAKSQQEQIAARIKQLKPEAERSERPAKLDLDFTVATQTVDFVSAVAEGQADVGDGAPTPLRATFNLHLSSGKIVGFADLFSDTDKALTLFSDEVRRRLYAQYEARLYQQNLPQAEQTARLKEMHALVESGTQPNVENFAAYLIDGVDGKAIGITILFAPGHVAPVAEGAQQVEVPVKLFVDAVKPEYRDAFDKESAALPTTPAASTGVDGSH